MTRKKNQTATTGSTRETDKSQSTPVDALTSLVASLDDTQREALMNVLSVVKESDDDATSDVDVTEAPEKTDAKKEKSTDALTDDREKDDNAVSDADNDNDSDSIITDSNESSGTDDSNSVTDSDVPSSSSDNKSPSNNDKSESNESNDSDEASDDEPDYKYEPDTLEIDDDLKAMVEDALSNDPGVKATGLYSPESAADDYAKDMSELFSDDSDGDNADDDEEYDDGDDPTYDEMVESETIMDNTDSGAVKVLDRVIVYEMDGLINPKTGKPYSRIKLSQKPPMMRFKQHSTGDTTGASDTEVSMVVDKNLALKLRDLMDSVVRSYEGMPLDEKVDRKPFSIKNVKQKIEDDWKYEPLKVVLTVVIIVILIIAVVYGFIVG